MLTKLINSSVLVSITIIIIITGLLQNINCQGIKCGHPAVPLNSRVTLSSTELEPGTTATYKCDEGYETFGNTQTVCSSTGQWVGELPFCGTNIAYRKPANQSTTVRGGSALNANDGDSSTEHDGKRCSETQKEASPWWRVNLLQSYSVKVVRVTTRGCCGHQPLQDLEIRVGNSSNDLQRNPLCAWFPGTIDEGITKTFTCARTLTGQYVFLQLVGVEGSLSLCEVEVFTADEFSIDRCAPRGAPEDVQIAPFARTCYEFGVGKGGSFDEARTYCKGHNGDLVHGMSPGATAFLYAELERRKPMLKTQLVWIGAQKEPGITSRTWKWVNGDQVLRPSWGKDQPNNYNGEQNCVVLDGGRGWLWNDVGCNLDYLHWICQHTPSSCGSPDKQLNTTIIVKNRNYDIGSTIEYQCPDGHKLIGDSKRTCDKDGFWSGIAPKCKYIDCSSLSDLEHGFVTLQDKRTTFGAKALYTCHENYTLIGHELRICDENGAWTNSTPQCLFDWCPNPPNIPGGSVTTSGHRTGDIATYTCQPGFILFGQGVLSCTLGGEWSGKPPSCKYVDCGSPPNIDNGRYDLINGTTTVDSIIEYSCGDDYWLIGEQIQKCTRDGRWSADTPACELITCEQPLVPSFGYIIGYDFNVHSTITYHCEAGHILIGDNTRTCLRDGDWSGTAPTCKHVDCGKVPPLLYGTVNYSGNTSLGDVIKYSCTKNYRLNGVDERTCLETGQWSDSSPKCEEIRCPEPVLAEHSILSVTGNDRMYGRTLIRTADSANTAQTYKIGALAKYRCERGYKVIGEPLSTCEDTGKWSGDVPQCVYVDCGNPGKIVNGRVTLASNATYYGALALYACDPNFELDGVSRRLCLENGTWSSDTPACREILCRDPDVLEGVSVKVSTRSVGGVAVYACPRGHSMQGNSTRICLKNGVWSGQAPSCIPIDCKHPGSIENGRVIVMNGTTYNSAIEYHCVPNYERIGPYLRKCMESGDWSGEEPRCEVSTNEPQETSNLGTSIGIGAGIVVFLLLLLGIIYLKLRKPVPVKNTENVEGAERKEDRNAAVMSYATLSDRNGYGHHLPPSIYENIHDENMYDAPYEETSRDSGTYEPEPIGRSNGNMVTINGVSVR